MKTTNRLLSACAVLLFSSAICLAEEDTVSGKQLNNSPEGSVSDSCRNEEARPAAVEFCAYSNAIASALFAVRDRASADAAAEVLPELFEKRAKVEQQALMEYEQAYGKEDADEMQIFSVWAYRATLRLTGSALRLLTLSPDPCYGSEELAKVLERESCIGEAIALSRPEQLGIQQASLVAEIADAETEARDSLADITNLQEAEEAANTLFQINAILETVEHDSLLIWESASSGTPEEKKAFKASYNNAVFQIMHILEPSLGARIGDGLEKLNTPFYGCEVLRKEVERYNRRGQSEH